MARDVNRATFMLVRPMPLPGDDNVPGGVSPADWLVEQLSPPTANVVTSIVPRGFEAYAKILHPVPVGSGGSETIRWAEVSHWSQVPLHPAIQWHEVTLPEVVPSLPPPWSNQGPREGSLSRDYTETLIEDLTSFTTGPCFFAIWDGYGPAGVLPQPEPRGTSYVERSRRCPRIRLPFRDYEVFEGALPGAVGLDASGRRFQSPNVWWPEDHSWCVASEIDLPWTYVGGSRDLINELLHDSRLEALQVLPGDPVSVDFAAWLRQRIDVVAEQVVRTGSATMTLAAGDVEVKLELLDRVNAVLITKSWRRSGWAGANRPIRTRKHDELLEEVRRGIGGAVLALVQ